MDTMRLRLQGTPQHPLLMRLLLVVIRVCLAAHLAGKNADTLLGRKGIILRGFLDRSRLANLVIRCTLKYPSTLIGIGGQSIVVESLNKPGYIEKYNYTLAGADPKVLREVAKQHATDQKDMESHFKGFVHPTEFGIAAMPLRWPFNRLVTLRSKQARLHDWVDIFSPEAEQIIAKAGQVMSGQVDVLATQARAWSERNKWLDLVGPNNIAIITGEQNLPHICIIDTGLYATEYITDINPVLGRSYKDVFMERLQTLESYCAKY